MSVTGGAPRTGAFTIQEIPTDGSPGERFVWTAGRSPAPGQMTGARACPIQPWPLGGKLRTVRTDYPGSRQPSEQVLGPMQKPFKLSGQWDDRYNRRGDFVNGGYAVAEMRRFEAMCERGNPCRFSYLSITRDGLIIDWDIPYKREWQIGYSFEVSVHDNPTSPKALDRSPTTTDSPAASFDKTDTAVQTVLEAHDTAPSSVMSGTTITDVETQLSAMTSARMALGQTLDNNTLDPPDQPIDAFTRLATQFRAVRGAAFAVLDEMATVRADLNLSTMTAMSVLNFESWSRELRYTSRIAMNEAQNGDDSATQRAAPDAIRLYRPLAGESLYTIARKFYGTPFAWRLIYGRNNLHSFTLAGTETLIIPERGSPSQ